MLAWLNPAEIKPTTPHYFHRRSLAARRGSFERNRSTDTITMNTGLIYTRRLVSEPSL